MKATGFCGQADRTVYFDYLRVFAAFSVIILHISTQNWNTADVNGFEWKVFNFCNSIVRWGVPVFVMISGALFLNREIPIKKIYSKYVLRMAVSFVVWSAIYAAFSGGDIVEKILKLLDGHYHMWFIPLIIGLYICIPFINLIIKNDNIMKYYLVLAFVFAFAAPTIMTLVNDFAGELVVQGVSLIKSNITHMHMHMVLGYASYFILGYYLNKIVLSKKQRMFIYLLGVMGAVATMCLDFIVALKTQEPCQEYCDNFHINILLESVAVFTWFQYREYHSVRLYPLVVKLSKYSFGAYLVHVLVIEQLDSLFGLNTLSFHPILAIGCIGSIVFFVSFLISGILNQIPVIKKYIV